MLYVCFEILLKAQGSLFFFIFKNISLQESISQEGTSHSGNETSRDDLLAKAIKRKEHPDRVRGVGFGVSQRDYFKDPKPASEKEMENLRNMVKSLSETMVAMQQRIDVLEAPNSRQPHEDDVISLKDSSPEPGYKMLPEVKN